MTLTDLQAMLERRAAEAEREGATAPVANVYRLVLGELAKVNGNGNGDSGGQAPATCCAACGPTREDPIGVPSVRSAPGAGRGMGHSVQ